MTARSVSCLLLAGLILLGCAHTPNSSGRPGKVNREGYYIVKSGDTLYGIAKRQGMGFKELARLNGMRSPYLIRPGQKIAVKGRALKQSKSSNGGSASKATRTRKTARSSGYVNRESWRWPTSGPVVRSYTQSGKVHKGIDIGGKISQPVVAVKSGKVVYAGTGLKAYGLLVIIKHDDHYLSAYAYNRRAYVREGDNVRKGQKIAQMGAKDGGPAKLHFEIRKDGKPLNPITVLPAR